MKSIIKKLILALLAFSVIDNQNYSASKQEHIDIEQIKENLQNLIEDSYEDLDYIEKSFIRLGIYGSVIESQLDEFYNQLGFIKAETGKLGLLSAERSIPELNKKIKKLANAIKNRINEINPKLKAILDSIEKNIDEMQKIAKSEKQRIIITILRDELAIYKTYLELGIAESYEDEINKLAEYVRKKVTIKQEPIIGQKEKEKKISEEVERTPTLESEEFNAIKTKLLNNYSTLISQIDTIVTDINKENLGSRNRQNRVIEGKLIQSGRRQEITNLKNKLAQMSLIEKLSLYKPKDDLIKQILIDQNKAIDISKKSAVIIINQQEKILKEKLGERALNYINSYAWFSLLRTLFGLKENVKKS